MLTEAIFSHRMILLEAYHELGKTVVKKNLSIEETAHKIGQRPKTVHYAVELYKHYPDLNSLPDGKAVSWYKVTKTLPPYEKNKVKKAVKAKD